MSDPRNLVRGTPVWVKQEKNIPGTERHGGDLFSTWASNDTETTFHKGVVLAECGEEKLHTYTQEDGVQKPWRIDVYTPEELQALMEEREQREQIRASHRKQKQDLLDFATAKGPRMFQTAWGKAS